MPHATPLAKLRVVLDTNVLVSAFQFPSGTAATLWDALGANRYVLISSPAIIKELASILRQTFALSLIHILWKNNLYDYRHQ